MPDFPLGKNGEKGTLCKSRTVPAAVSSASFYNKSLTKPREDVKIWSKSEDLPMSMYHNRFRAKDGVNEESVKSLRGNINKVRLNVRFIGHESMFVFCFVLFVRIWKDA